MCPKLVWHLQYLALWARTGSAVPAFGVAITGTVGLVGDFMPFTPYRSRSFLHEPWTSEDVGPHSLMLSLCFRYMQRSVVTPAPLWQAE